MTEQQPRPQDFHQLIYDKGYKLTTLAKAAGLNDIVMLSHWQRGAVLYPRQESLKKVAAVLGVSADALFAAIRESYYKKHESERPSDPPDRLIAA